jgi:hypothetical protein
MARTRVILLILLLSLAHREVGGAQEPIVAAGTETKGLRCVALGATSIDLETIQPSSGNKGLDNYLSTESARLIELFGLAPDLSYIDAPEWDNAAAASEPLNEFTSGTVYLGIKLLRTEFPDALRGRHAVVGILAHEFGHILQYKYEGATFTDPFETEIHADFMAGYYIARRALTIPTDVDNLAVSLFLRADAPEFFQAPDHGNGYQRVAAMLAGYYSQSLTPSDAYNAGRKVASELKTSIDNSTNYEVIVDADPQARAQVQITSSYRFRSNLSNPGFRYTARLQNQSAEPVIVALIADAMVAPADDVDNSKALPLTRRLVQRRILPRQGVRIDLDIRSTAQSDVIETYLAERWVVAFERNLQPQTQPEEPADSASGYQLDWLNQ